MAKCEFPFSKRDKITGEYMDFPCGKCPDCKKRRVSSWSFRLTRHSRDAQNAYFVTLTYNTDNVPITPKGYMSLNKRDCQLFFKRLRKLHGKSAIKYYIVGEYGGKTNRPHYHALIFNVDILKVEKSWQLGEIHVGEVNEASVGYTLKYMAKDGKIPMHKNDDRIPEFAHMSKGLGANYLTSQMKDWHNADELNRMYVPLSEGKKIAMPRYYKNKIYTDEQRRKIGNHLNNLERFNNDKNHVAKTEQQRIDLSNEKHRKFINSRLNEKL